MCRNLDELAAMLKLREHQQAQHNTLFTILAQLAKHNTSI